MSWYVLPVSSTNCGWPLVSVTLKSAVVCMPVSFAAYTIGSTLICVLAPPPIFSNVSRTPSIADSLSLSVKCVCVSVAMEPVDDGSPPTSGAMPSATPTRLRCCVSLSLPKSIVAPLPVLAPAESSSVFDRSPRCAA
ncbi:hypothetical protein BamIOP4010DRAFT_6441 [Burkholderia ambifaria IOP40-10]|uniref:Uncharacterized protein n=1 Tax=Burkholderia ambifaria IOP40-10 TaxID=396596 RepID=B1FQY0_9BURK|nr:hypothetical protein BamIOP4010DRAFT_6441 [Burkholderia ambifaria IOP40-10]